MKNYYSWTRMESKKG